MPTKKTRTEIKSTKGPIESYFKKEDSPYFVLPRSVLNSMPLSWQRKFRELVDELDATLKWKRPKTEYVVFYKSKIGSYTKDELADINYRIKERGSAKKTKKKKSPATKKKKATTKKTKKKKK